ncbi:hypothetical protein SEA_JEMERALD_48 [Microbacterium phage Jemerald]|nr:hypothetical protein SEA_JEMERALD_48 [Microbacterium phage Jemerald]
MGAKTVLLHGGPYHGRYVAVPAENDHFHIREMPQDAFERAMHDEVDTFHVVQSREGTYSQVSGPNHHNDFEWDGWVSH